MRVLTVTNLWPTPERPWYGIFVARQMRSLDTVGISVDVLSITGAGSPLRSLGAYLKAALKIVRLNFGPRRYDLIHAHTGHCGLLSCLQFRYPVVLSYVGYDIDITADKPDTFRTRVSRAFFRSLSLGLAGTIAKSKRGHDHLPRAGQRRNTVIPNGVDREAFAPMARAEARRQLGEGDDERPWALFPADPGRYNKRFELAEGAVEFARRTHPDLQLKVAQGTDPKLMPVWMNAADLLAMSSRAEGSPNVVKESMACDLPVVGVAVGDVAEVIEGARNCHVCEPTNESMGAAMVAVIDALPERSNGRDHTEHLGLEAIAKQVRAVYEQAVGRGAGLAGFRQRRA